MQSTTHEDISYNLQIMDLFTDHLSLSTSKTNISKFLAYNVEASINALHCSIGDSKSYIAKARSLSYNLKRNEVSAIQLSGFFHVLTALPCTNEGTN
jgi:hypothetical protein